MSDEPNQRDEANTQPNGGASLRDALGIRPGADYFQILGVADADRTPERIVAALQDQLAKLNAHPDSETPEADQLRMTLHAAAADAIRDVLSARSEASPVAESPLETLQGPATSQASARSQAQSPRAMSNPQSGSQIRAGGAPSAPTPRGVPSGAAPMQGSPVALEAMAHMILGMHGGWNDASRRHLMLLARTQGASPEQLIQTMQGMTRRGSTPMPATPTGRAPASATPAPTIRPPAAPQAPAYRGASNAAPMARPVQSQQPIASQNAVSSAISRTQPLSSAMPRAESKPAVDEAAAIARVRAIAAEQPDPTKRLLLFIGVGSFVVILILVGMLVVAILLANAAKGRGGAGANAGGGVSAGAGAGTSGGAGGPVNTPQLPPPVSSSPTGIADVPSSSTRDPNVALPSEPPKPLFETPKPATTSAPASSTGNESRALRRWDDILRDLRSLAESASADRASTADQFAKLFAEMGRAWVDTTPDGHAAAADAVVELLYRMSGDREPMLRALRAIESAASLDTIPRAQQVRARAFAGGVVARMARERDLPSVVRGRLDEMAPRLLGSAWTGSGATFRMGAVGALSEASSALLPPVVDPDAANRTLLLDSWREWVRDIDAAEQGRTQEGTRRIMQALEDVMLAGPDPAANRATYEVIGLLATSLTWRDGDASRDRLIRWFDAPGINASDLHALTSALANSSAAASIDLSMVLSITADEGQRSVLRDRYAAVWSLSAAGARTAQVQDLIQRARGALYFPANDAPAHLSNGAYMAHLNAVAAYAWAGEPFPGALMAGPSAVTPAPVPAAALAPGSTVTFNAPSGSSTPEMQSTWGAQYLAAGPSIPARRELLQRVVGPLTKLDASVLANEAVRGSPQSVRQEAMDISRKFLGDAAMIEALLELAPQIPATIDNTELLESATGVPLPPPRDATWRLEVRRALVARLLELLGGKSLREVDELSRQFAEAYAAAVDQANPPKASGANIVVDPPAAGVSAIALRALWQRRAHAVLPSGREPMTLAQINAARPSRLRLARTPIQALSVEQANIAELMAFVVVAERPDTASQAGEILSDLGQQRAQAEHIFEQLEAGERAILRLWLLRFGESTMPEPTP